MVSMAAAIKNGSSTLSNVRTHTENHVMAMRTYDYFACPNGHLGEEKTTENDQPYSKSWERVSTKGLRNGPNDTYLCEICGLPMSRVPKPQP